MEKFINSLQKGLMPIANKLSDNNYLSALGRAFSFFCLSLSLVRLPVLVHFRYPLLAKFYNLDRFAACIYADTICDPQFDCSVYGDCVPVPVC